MLCLQRTRFAPEGAVSMLVYFMSSVQLDAGWQRLFAKSICEKGALEACKRHAHLARFEYIGDGGRFRVRLREPWTLRKGFSRSIWRTPFRNSDPFKKKQLFLTGAARMAYGRLLCSGPSRGSDRGMAPYARQNVSVTTTVSE